MVKIGATGRLGSSVVADTAALAARVCGAERLAQLGLTLHPVLTRADLDVAARG
jgi:hypothetical protein